jgi:hypothetical protein
LEAITDARTHLRRVLADTASENDCIRAVHRREICADVLPCAITKDFDRELASAIILFARFCKQLAHIAR